MKILKEKIIIFLFLFATNLALGQSVTFKKVYPAFASTPQSYSVACKPYNNDKSFLIFASLKLAKINESGDVFSSKVFLNFGYSAHASFNYPYSFTFYSDHTHDKKLLKLDTSFNFISIIQFDNLDWESSDKSIICPDSGNGFLLSSYKEALTPAIVRTDSGGIVIWSKYFTTIQGGIQDIVQTKDRGFVIATNLINSGASLIKTDDNGNVVWAKSYFRPSGYIHNVLENDDETMIITGNLDSTYISSPLFFVKLDKTGNVMWAKTFGDTINRIRNYLSETRPTQDGGYITLATLAIGNLQDDLLLIKTDVNGDTIWVRAHGSSQSNDDGRSIEQLNDKGYIVCGTTNNNIPISAATLYLIRTDSLGHTDSLCEEYSLPIAKNNITVNDSNITVTSIPFTITTSTPVTNTQSFTTIAYDGCHLDGIAELMAKDDAPLIYPNPSDGKFTVEIKTNTPEKSVIEIYYITGEKVYSANTTKNTVNIDLTVCSKGLYFIRISNDKIVKTGKVIVE